MFNAFENFGCLWICVGPGLALNERDYSPYVIFHKRVKGIEVFFGFCEVFLFSGFFVAVDAIFDLIAEIYDLNHGLFVTWLD
jgi:hypothetical protein